MKTVKVYFCDQNPGHTPKTSLFYTLISKHFNIVLTSKDPDYVFCSVFPGQRDAFGRLPPPERFLYPDAITIMFSGENTMPDLNFCDYGIGFDHLTFGDRYLRVPLYAVYGSYKKLLDPRVPITLDDLKARREFCNFTFSNRRAMPERDDFFHRLSAKKHVISTGRHLRNSNALDILQRDEKLKNTAAKVAFLEQFKFNIAFENCRHPGYTTEKLMEPFAAGCLPIYYGNPRVAEDFNTAAFINAQDYPDMDAVVDEVMRLDRDDAALLDMLNTDPILPSDRGNNSYANRLESFLCSIIDQPKEAARRRAKHGRIAATYREMSQRAHRVRRKWWRR